MFGHLASRRLALRHGWQIGNHRRHEGISDTDLRAGKIGRAALQAFKDSELTIDRRQIRFQRILIMPT